ncbi:MAG: hypothetical protein H7X88_04680 [Gloeobacteraceae cyanobacterium ES-bin-316]|nr:hypothetical protein [Ferruginibacter sp.]
MEAGAYGFADVEIKRDTIIIKYLPTVVYKLSDKAFNYKIKLDTTIRMDYWREKVEEKGKIKK